MDDQHALIGHNSKGLPLYDEFAFGQLRDRVTSLAETGGTWLDLGKLDTEDRAQRAVDFTAQVKKVTAAVEAERKKAKQPHLDAGKAVDEAFQKLAAPLKKLSDGLARMLTEFQREKQAKLDAERREREAVERARAEEARRAAEEAERRNDVIGQAAAEEAAKEAEKAAKLAAKPQAARIESATGGARTVAMRTYWTASFDADLPRGVARVKALNALARNPAHAEKIDAFLLQLAEAERRAKDGAESIPGVVFTSEQRAV